MKRLERFSGVFAFAGVGCFLLAAGVEGFLPAHHVGRVPVKTLAALAPEPSDTFRRLAERYPASFRAAFGEPTAESFQRALRRGRDVYVAEACWHCHSQFVRPVANENTRFGAVSTAAEYQNELFLPHLFGTRRVGPDLIREAGRHAPDWHVAHFFDPTSVAPTSVMPRFPWFFDAAEQPNERGLAIITYVDWLGSWVPEEERVE